MINITGMQILQIKLGTKVLLFPAIHQTYVGECLCLFSSKEPFKTKRSNIAVNMGTSTQNK